MGLQAYTGTPGSGKTARVVADLLKGPFGRSAFIVHNIDGLRGGAVSPEGFCRTVDEVSEALGLGPEEDFWTKPVQERFTQEVEAKYKRKVLLIIDEAQNLFGRKSLTQDRLAWISYSRHYGQTVWLITQHLDLLARDVVPLLDCEIRARRGIVTNAFVYQYFCNGVPYRWDRGKVCDAVYGAYSSAQLHAPGLGKSRLLVFGVVGMLVFGGGFVAYASRLRHKGIGADHQARAAEGERPQPVAPAPGVGAVVAPVVPVAVKENLRLGGGVPVRPAGIAAGAAPVPGGRVSFPVKVVEKPVELHKETLSLPAAVPWSGWYFAGFIGGLPYLAKGSELVKACDVLGCEWRVVGADEGRRVLHVLHRASGPGEIAGGPGMWFGVDG